MRCLPYSLGDRTSVTDFFFVVQCWCHASALRLRQSQPPRGPQQQQQLQPNGTSPMMNMPPGNMPLKMPPGRQLQWSRPGGPSQADVNGGAPNGNLTGSPIMQHHMSSPTLTGQSSPVRMNGPLPGGRNPPMNPHPSLQQLSQHQPSPPVNHPADQGGLPRPTNALGSMNIPVPQPPTHLMVHPVGCKNLTSQISVPQRVAEGGYSSVYKAAWKPSPQVLHVVSIIPPI